MSFPIGFIGMIATAIYCCNKEANHDKKVKPYVLRILHSCRNGDDIKLVMRWIGDVMFNPPIKYCQDYGRFLRSDRRKGIKPHYIKDNT